VRLRGRDNVRKRYIAHIAALNLGLVMRTLFGHGTPREAANAVLVVLVAATWRVLRAMEAIGHSVLGIFLPLVTVRPLGTARSMA
jgi:hypothetical protein